MKLEVNNMYHGFLLTEERLAVCPVTEHRTTSNGEEVEPIEQC